MKVKVSAKYCKEEAELTFAKYSNGSMAIIGYSEFGEPLFTATVALSQLPPEGHIFLKGWSENEGIPEALEKAGIVKLTGRTIPTGYVEAVEAKLLTSE
jgi:hypothetical protein